MGEHLRTPPQDSFGVPRYDRSARLEEAVRDLGRNNGETTAT